jgi:hypothetical protein
MKTNALTPALLQRMDAYGCTAAVERTTDLLGAYGSAGAMAVSSLDAA